MLPYFFNERKEREDGSRNWGISPSLSPCLGTHGRGYGYRISHSLRPAGAGLTCTEMVSGKALCYQNQKTIPLMELAPCESPKVVQLFGSDPVAMEEGAAIAKELSGADILDINMGCPVPKIANSGDGSGLMRTPDLAYQVAEAVMRGGKCPVTVKFRLGWDKSSINCVEFAQGMEAVGVAAVAVHGRTKKQMYEGEANWDYIRQVKQAVSVPVIANGDVFSAQDAQRILSYTGADVAMIGRGIFGNPWLFAQSKALLEGKELPPKPTVRERCEMAQRQLHLSAQYKGEKLACLEARRHYNWYLKGIPHTGYWKSEIAKITTLEDIDRITKGIVRDLGRERSEQ